MRANCSGASPANPARELRRQDLFGLPRFTLLQALADADDGSQPGFDRGRGLLENRLVGFAEILAAFAMADDHPAASGGNQHGRGNLAGIGAFLEPEQVLRTDADVRAARSVDRRGDIHERGADYDFRMGFLSQSLHQRGQIVQKTGRLGGPLCTFSSCRRSRDDACGELSGYRNQLLVVIDRNRVMARLRKTLLHKIRQTLEFHTALPRNLLR